MSDRTFGFMALFGFVPPMIWIVADGLRSRKIWSRYGPDAHRDQQPVLFWLHVVIYSIIATVMLFSSFYLLGWLA